MPTNEEKMNSSEKTESNSMRDSSQSCFKRFKPSQLGSPFYPGRTMYGGMASSYVYQPNIRQRKDRVVAPVNTSTADNTVSQSARRIMDLLENYSSPLNDSRRIPMYTRQPISHTNSHSNAASNTHPYNPAKSKAYKTQELHVPSIASILRLKTRSRLMDSTMAARQLIASHSSTSDFMPYCSPSPKPVEPIPVKEMNNKMTTKVKSRLTRHNNSDLESELPAEVNLPTAVLQIDQSKLPKFSIDPLSTQATPSTPATPSTSWPTVTATVTRSVESTVQLRLASFKFANPVIITAEDSAQSAMPSGFTFGSPDRTIDRPKENEAFSFDMITSKPLVTNENMKESKDWKCPDCWVVNKLESNTCVCCGSKKCAANSVEKDAVKISKPVVKKADGAWKCDDCWVNNDANSAKCLCCGGARPGGAAAGSAEQRWQCYECSWQNARLVHQCAACGAAPPQPAAASLKVTLTTHTDKWECTSCLVRNDSDKTKCVCCETEKPGLNNAPLSKTTFNFSTTANTTFKFGIPNANTTTAPQLIDVKSTVESKPKNEESETNNNILPKIPSFTFGLPSKTSTDQTDSLKKQDKVTSETTKLNFSFGIPKTVESTAGSTNVTSTMTFSLPSKEDSTPKTEESQEKCQEVPKINVSMDKLPDATKTFANFFTPPVSQSVQDKTSSVSAPLGMPQVVETSVSSATTSSITMFSFGGTATSGGLFATPSATPAFTAPAFSAPATTGFTVPATVTFTAPATSTFTAPTTIFTAPVTTATQFFQKREPTLTTSSTLAFSSTSTPLNFQKSEGPVTSAPIFNFGSNAPSANVKTEPPKFNFSFGSNSTTDKALFNSATDNNNTNKFSLPNIFGSASGVTNALSGVNGIGSSVPATTATSALPSGGGVFGAAPPKDSLWTPPSSVPGGVFPTTAPAVTPQQPPAFTFGTSTPFNATAAPEFGANSQAPPAFGSAAQSTTPFAAAAQTTPAFGTVTQSAPAFGAQTTLTFGAPVQPTPTFGASSTPAFGTSTPTPSFGTASQPGPFGTAPQPTANLFGLGSQNGTSQASPFGSSGAAPGLFGSALGAPSAGGLFGSPAATAPTFGTPNPLPRFEAPSATATPIQPFNFTPPSTGVFGFGQQQQQPGGGVYAFNAGGAGGGVQFNMGSGSAAQPTPARRVIRKAIRRNNVRQ